MLTKLNLEGDEYDHHLEKDATQSNMWGVELDAVEAGVAALEEKLVRTYDWQHD